LLADGSRLNSSGNFGWDRWSSKEGEAALGGGVSGDCIVNWLWARWTVRSGLTADAPLYVPLANSKGICTTIRVIKLPPEQISRNSATPQRRSQDSTARFFSSGPSVEYWRLPSVWQNCYTSSTHIQAISSKLPQSTVNAAKIISGKFNLVHTVSPTFPKTPESSEQIATGIPLFIRTGSGCIGMDVVSRCELLSHLRPLYVEKSLAQTSFLRHNRSFYALQRKHTRWDTLRAQHPVPCTLS
jgi:hypothetical protein